jgi:glycosyltransferase involved in cell wall biosynthesis
MSHWSVPGDRVHAVAHGVDSELYQPGRTGAAEVLARAGGDPLLPYVLFVSQIHPRKNLGALREAMARLVRVGLAHQLVVVGSAAQDRTDSDNLDREAAADLPGAPGSVAFFRDIDEADLASLMAGAAAFCLPSFMEGFGMTVLEAMSCGVPVVVSDRGSLPEVVGDAGIVAAPTADAIESALGEILAAPDRAAELGRRGRARALEFPWSRTVDGWYDALKMAASTRSWR